MWKNFKNGWYSFVREVTFQPKKSDPMVLPEKPFKRISQIPLKKKKVLKKISKKRTPDVYIVEKEPETTDPEVVEKFETRVDPPKAFDVDEQYIETPQQRIDRVERKQPIQTMSGKRRQLLFINPGTEVIKQAIWAIKNNGVKPDWAEHFDLFLQGNTLYFEGLPFLTTEEKKELVKREYFDPKGFATINPMKEKFQKEYANISRADVTRALRSIEVYQLNFRRRRPPKILGRMVMKKPGIILCDMFFPSRNLGWERMGGVLTMTDAYSRYVQCYAVEKKNKPLVKRGMEDFMQRFVSLGHLPLYILSDKGTDLSPNVEVMEKFRNGRTGPLVLYSKTGKPVNLVEQVQSEVQRRMAIFRTAGLTDSPGLILADICESINNQPRPIRGNLSPLQLLALDREGRARINADRKIGSTEHNGMRELFIGSHVRTLLMTMKQQLGTGGPGAKKGFEPKWSRDVYKVKRKRALAGNPMNYRYFLDGLQESFYRHELLWVPPKIDREIFDLIGNNDETIYEDFSE